MHKLLGRRGGGCHGPGDDDDVIIFLAARGRLVVVVRRGTPDSAAADVGPTDGEVVVVHCEGVFFRGKREAEEGKKGANSPNTPQQNRYLSKFERKLSFL